MRALAATVSAALALGAAAGCAGDDGGERQASSRNEARFTREDGSAVRFDASLRAWCGRFDADNPDVEGVHVLGGGLPWGEERESFWMVRAVRADVEREPETRLPNSFVYDKPRAAGAFVFDAEHRENELSSAEEEAGGVVRVELEGCEAGDEVRVEFEEVVLGSEFSDRSTVRVDGVVTAEIGEEPSRIGS